MQNTKLRLDAWRAAEHRRDALALDSSEWQEAEQDARSAAKLFHAEVAQASARYAEADFYAQRPRSLPWDSPHIPCGRVGGGGFPRAVAAALRSITQVHAGAGQDPRGRRS